MCGSNTCSEVSPKGYPWGCKPLPIRINFACYAAHQIHPNQPGPALESLLSTVIAWLVGCVGGARMLQHEVYGGYASAQAGCVSAQCFSTISTLLTGGAEQHDERRRPIFLTTASCDMKCCMKLHTKFVQVRWPHQRPRWPHQRPHLKRAMVMPWPSTTLAWLKTSSRLT